MSGIIHRGDSTTSTRKRRKKKQNLEITYSFDTNIDVFTLGCSVMETLTHLLYTRNQIPLPLAMLRQVMAKRAKSSPQPLRPGKQIGRRKTDNTIENLSTIALAIRDVFSIYHVNFVVLVLGSTVISPKETFLVSIGSDVQEETDSPDNTSNSDVPKPNGAVVRGFLRHIVTNENLNELPSLCSLQNIHILVNLEGECELNEKLSDVFVPKMNYHLSSTRGAFHTLHLSSRSNEETFSLQSVLANCNENSTNRWYAAKLPMKGFKY